MVKWWYVTLGICLTLFSSLPVLSAPDIEARERQIAAKEKKLPGCSRELLSWLVDVEAHIHKLLGPLNKTRIFSGSLGSVSVDFYIDESGELQKLGGPYFLNADVSPESIEEVDVLVAKLRATLPSPPSRLRGALILLLNQNSANKAQAEVFIGQYYFAPDPKSEVYKSECGGRFVAKEDPDTDKWLSSLEERFNKELNHICVPGWEAEIQESKPLTIMFEISRQGWLRYLKLDDSHSVKANKMAMELFNDKMPFLHRPRNLTESPCILQLSNQNGKLYVSCKRYVGRIIYGRIGEQGIPARRLDN